MTKCLVAWGHSIVGEKINVQIADSNRTKNSIFANANWTEKQL